MNMKFYEFDLRIDSVTVMLKPNLDMVKIDLCIEKWSL